MNIQEMKKRLPELELLERQRDNGAIIEHRLHNNKWSIVDSELFSTYEYRIQQPPPQEGYEWCGYDVPTDDNCDKYIIANNGILRYSASSKRTDHNRHRHLYRKVEPKPPVVVQYTLDTFVLKSSHVKCKKESLLYAFNTTRNGIELITGECSLCVKLSWKKAYAAFEWPDGSPFGVEVT